MFSFKKKKKIKGSDCNTVCSRYSFISVHSKHKYHVSGFFQTYERDPEWVTEAGGTEGIQEETSGLQHSLSSATNTDIINTSIYSKSNNSEHLLSFWSKVSHICLTSLSLSYSLPQKSVQEPHVDRIVLADLWTSAALRTVSWPLSFSYSLPALS